MAALSYALPPEYARYVGIVIRVHRRKMLPKPEGKDKPGDQKNLSQILWYSWLRLFLSQQSSHTIAL